MIRITWCSELEQYICLKEKQCVCMPQLFLADCSNVYLLIEHSPLGELGPWGTVCPLGVDISANILEFSLPGEHWPLPGRQRDTQQSFIVLYNTAVVQQTQHNAVMWKKVQFCCFSCHMCNYVMVRAYLKRRRWWWGGQVRKKEFLKSQRSEDEIIGDIIHS